MFEFDVVPGSAIKVMLAANLPSAIKTVERAYLAHHDGQTVNPDSYFLQFPKSPSNRIIALPASIDGESGVCGIKWIASFPDNIKSGVPRASAVLLLNDPKTGYPYACLEGSLISAVRTAASAVLGAYWLNDMKRKTGTMAFIGAGVIARNIMDMFVADDWDIQSVSVHDNDMASMQAFCGHAASYGKFETRIQPSLDEALQADVIVFATNAGTPYVTPPAKFHGGQVVLNISLRDIAPELILDAVNVFDDVDHCMKANTSAHLAEQKSGNRNFVTGTLAQLIRGEKFVDRTKPLIFSPFGMGILDLALGKDLHEVARRSGLTTAIPDFFGEIRRW